VAKKWTRVFGQTELNGKEHTKYSLYRVSVQAELATC